MSRLRVLWLIKGLGPGGAEQLLLQAARAGDHERFEYHVAYAVPGKDQLVAALSKAGVEIHGLSEPDDGGPRWIARLRSLIRTGQFDIVHTHSPLLAGVARLIVRTGRSEIRPVHIFTEHNRWDQYRGATRWLNRLTYRLDDVTLAVSGGVRDSVSPRYRSRVHVLHHGIDLDHVRHHAAYREEARAELGLGPEAVLVGIVANLRREKAYEDLLAATHELVERVPDIQVVSIGQGPVEADLRRFHGELQLGDRFRFLGYRADVLRLLSAFDVFTLSSHFEGLPVAVMEAQALGLPVVATSVGGLPEVIEHGVDGLLVPPRQPSALATALATVAEDPELRRSMGAAARERASRFDGVRATASIQEHYQRAIAMRKVGS